MWALGLTPSNTGAGCSGREAAVGSQDTIAPAVATCTQQLLWTAETLPGSTWHHALSSKFQCGRHVCAHIHVPGIMIALHAWCTQGRCQHRMRCGRHMPCHMHACRSGLMMAQCGSCGGTGGSCVASERSSARSTPEGYVDDWVPHVVWSPLVKADRVVWVHEA